MKKLFLAVLVPALIVSAGLAQEKPWSDWTKAEAEKILNNSAWGQTQTDTDTSEMVYTPTTNRGSTTGTTTGRTTDQQSVNNNRMERGATNQAISTNYHVRLLSAKPVRQAFMRLISLTQKDEDGQLTEGLKAFVERDFKDYIVVAVTYDSTDARFSGPAMQAFGSAAIGTIKNQTYLERKDGKRIFPIDYRPPTNDGLGAKFVFARKYVETDFLDTNSGTMRFYCELTKTIKLNVTYKIANMMYEGKLEY